MHLNSVYQDHRVLILRDQEPVWQADGEGAAAFPLVDAVRRRGQLSAAPLRELPGVCASADLAALHHHRHPPQREPHRQ